MNIPEETTRQTMRHRPCECGHYLLALVKDQGLWWCAACGRALFVHDDGNVWLVPHHELEGVSREQEIADEQAWLAEDDAQNDAG